MNVPTFLISAWERAYASMTQSVVYFKVTLSDNAFQVYFDHRRSGQPVSSLWRTILCSSTSLNVTRASKRYPSDKRFLYIRLTRPDHGLPDSAQPTVSRQQETYKDS